MDQAQFRKKEKSRQSQNQRNQHTWEEPLMRPEPYSCTSNAHDAIILKNDMISPPPRTARFYLSNSTVKPKT